MLRTLILILALLCATSCFAAELQCPPDETLKQLQTAAAQGDAKSQFDLAWAYYRGNPAPHDEAQAVTWWRKSAEQGYSEAQYDLGKAYDEGVGTKQDSTQAFKWYRKAASKPGQGRGPAENNLGQDYHDGFGVKQDYAKALYWWRRSAGHGNSYAQENIGRA